MTTNYIIEGNIDFFQELYKSLDTEEQDENKDKSTGDNEFAINSNVCLITNQILENNYVKMNCGHKFNYVPLYKYLINYKQKFNLMENTKQKLDINEIRCPYCRHKQSELLPYYEDMKGIKKINGINNLFIKPDLNIKNPSCCYKTYWNNTQSVLCGRIFTCQLPDKYKGKDDGYYCSTHIRKTIQKIDKEEKEEIKKQKIAEKQKLMEEKLKAKEELKKAKLEAKIQLQNQKQNPNKISKIEGEGQTENVMIDNITFCQTIIKYGANKGNHCSFKIYQNGLCKRHSQLIENKNKNK